MSNDVIESLRGLQQVATFQRPDEAPTIGQVAEAQKMLLACVPALLDVAESARLHMRGQTEPSDLAAALVRLEAL